ncbi:MAG: GNAT family N-acetyltransferase [Pseudorhodoplanes sp.]
MSEHGPVPYEWRPMTQADLTAVYRLSVENHPDFPERPEVLAEKFRLYPEGCFVLDKGGPAICGYCFSHPWLAAPPPALDALLQALPDAPTTYFIHDLTVDAALRGKKLASALVPRLVSVTRGIPLDRMMLVAVSGSEPFWTRMGFHRADNSVLQDAAKAKYGTGAMSMERNI